MTIDKFGRHIDHHKTRKHLHDINSEISGKINKVKEYLSLELSKIKQYLKSIIVINLNLKLKETTYSVNDSKYYTFPCRGKIVGVKLNNEKETLNYCINNSKPILSLINKSVNKGDELQIQTGPLSYKSDQLYMEILLETSVYYVED